MVGAVHADNTFAQVVKGTGESGGTRSRLRWKHYIHFLGSR